jgi:23S rRNA pseudouridine955/2504/2580 synthase
VPKNKKAVLTAYLKKDAESALVSIYDTEKKGSVLIKTGYEVIAEYGGYSDLLITLYTGKTHQIRAHLAHIGHAILGDGKYGDYALNNSLKLKRQLLTAVSLTLFFDKNSPLYYLNGKNFTIQTEF